MAAEPLITTPDGKPFCITATEYKGSNPQQTLTKHRRTMVAEPIEPRCVAQRGRYPENPKLRVAGLPTEQMFEAREDGKTHQVYEVRNGLITIKGKQYPIKLKDGYYIIRKLTVRECMRLQTVPEWYEFPVSDSQAYKMLGNGWTCEVIAHILKYLKEA